MKVLVAFAIGLAGALAFMTTGCSSSKANGQVKSVVAANMTAQQREFCQVLEHGFAEADRLSRAIYDERNPLRKEDLEKQQVQLDPTTFDRLYQVVGPTGQFSGWRGTVGWGKPDANGQINVSLDEICQRANLSLLTGDSLVEPKGNTGVPISSALGKALIEIDPGSKVIAGGRFVWARDVGRDGRLRDSHGAPISVCGDRHFYEYHLPACMPSVTSGRGVHPLVQFTAISRAR